MSTDTTREDLREQVEQGIRELRSDILAGGDAPFRAILARLDTLEARIAEQQRKLADLRANVDRVMA